MHILNFLQQWEARVSPGGSFALAKPLTERFVEEIGSISHVSNGMHQAIEFIPLYWKDFHGLQGLGFPSYLGCHGCEVQF